MAEEHNFRFSLNIFYNIFYWEFFNHSIIYPTKKFRKYCIQLRYNFYQILFNSFFKQLVTNTHTIIPIHISNLFFSKQIKIFAVFANVR